LRDLVSELDDAVLQRPLEASQANQFRRVAGDEEASAPQRSARICGESISRGLQRLGERRPAGNDIVAERSGERVITRERGVDQMKLGAQEAKLVSRDRRCILLGTATGVLPLRAKDASARDEQGGGTTMSPKASKRSCS